MPGLRTFKCASIYIRVGRAGCVDGKQKKLERKKKKCLHALCYLEEVILERFLAVVYLSCGALSIELGAFCLDSLLGKSPSVKA